MFARAQRIIADIRVTVGLAWLALAGIIDNIRNPPREEVEFGHVKVAGPVAVPDPEPEAAVEIDPDVVADLRERGVQNPEKVAAAWGRRFEVKPRDTWSAGPKLGADPSGGGIGFAPRGSLSQKAQTSRPAAAEAWAKAQGRKKVAQ